MPATWSASSKGTFVFDPKKLSWAAYNSSGQLVKSGAASGGQNYCYDLGSSCHTPSGTYAVFSKGSANCISNTYPLNEGGGAPMPYCMFFKGGYAIHGSYDVPAYNASHGCIRVHPTAAAWLSSSFIQSGTRVVVLPYY